MSQLLFSVLTRTWSKSTLTVWLDLNSPIFMLSFIRRSLSLGVVLNLNTLPV